jgi:NADH dehydrogenase
MRYIRKRGEGERVVRSALANAILIRPAVMFGPDDAFLTTILSLLRRLPVYPMFGRGLTRLQPAYVEDVAEAIGRVMQRAETPSTIFEFGGPRVYAYKEFLRVVAHQAGLAPPSWFRCRLLFGTHSHGLPKCSPVQNSLAIKWN